MSTRAQLIFRLLSAAAIGMAAAHLGRQLPHGNAETEAPPVSTPRSAKTIVVEIVNRIAADNLTLVAAGVAFYAFLALFPAAAALVAVFGLVADPGLVAGQVNELAGILPQSALDLVLGIVKGVAEKPRGQLGMAFAVSTLIALWSARAGVTSLMAGLDIAYRNKRVRSFVAATAVGLALTLGTILVAAALVVAIAGLPAIYAAAPAVFMKYGGPLIGWSRWPAIAAIMALSVSVLYRFAPSRPLPNRRLFSAGVGVATALWLASSSAFSLYVSWSGSYNVTYGSLAGAVVTMLWLWASSVAILVGATVDSVLKEPLS